LFILLIAVPSVAAPKSVKSTTESASIDSGRAVWGEAVSLMFGVTGSIGMNAAQQTRDEVHSYNDSEFHKIEDDWAFYYSPRAIDRRS
jgi:hypothetical protein